MLIKVESIIGQLDYFLVRKKAKNMSTVNFLRRVEDPLA